MARYVRIIALLILGLSLIGCVPQEKYNALKLERDRFKEQLDAAQVEASAARAEADSLKNQLAALLGAGNNKDSQLTNLAAQNQDLMRQLADLNRRYADVMNRPVEAGNALPPDLTKALKDFADANPDLVEFDPARGIVKFKSDVTFNSGDATLAPRAASIIDRFAQILKSPAAQGYEIIVAGHTDNVRVTNPETIRRGHKDNWYLSAHRAISVGNELQRTGVSPSRIAVTGYADQHPVASNATEAGKAQNRRVEVLILPQTVKLAPSGAAAADEEMPAAAPAKKATARKSPAVKKTTPAALPDVTPTSTGAPQ